MDIYRVCVCVCVCVCASYLGADVFVFQMINFLHSDEYTYKFEFQISAVQVLYCSDTYECSVHI